MSEVGGPAPESTAALVTGGGGGLGLAIAERLDGAGYRVVLLERDFDRVAEATEAFVHPPRMLATDVTDRTAVEAAVELVAREVGTPLVLVNAAGVAVSSALLPPDDELWMHTLAVNATGTWIASTACLGHMRDAGRGFICNIASTAALEGFRYSSAYVASKHAVLGLTRAMAADLVGSGVRVCALCPGFLDTPMTDRTVANMVERTGMPKGRAREVLAAMNLSARLIEPTEVADAVMGLLADTGAEGRILRLD